MRARVERMTIDMTDGADRMAILTISFKKHIVDEASKEAVRIEVHRETETANAFGIICEGLEDGVKISPILGFRPLTKWSALGPVILRWRTGLAVLELRPSLFMILWLAATVAGLLSSSNWAQNFGTWPLVWAFLFVWGLKSLLWKLWLVHRWWAGFDPALRSALAD